MRSYAGKGVRSTAMLLAASGLPRGLYARPCRLVLRGIRTVRIHENVGVSRNQLPLPSYAASRIRAQSAPSNAFCNPLPWALASRSTNFSAVCSSRRTCRIPSSITARSVVFFRVAKAFALRASSSERSIVVFNAMALRLLKHRYPHYAQNCTSGNTMAIVFQRRGTVSDH